MIPSQNNAAPSFWRGVASAALTVGTGFTAGRLTIVLITAFLTKEQ